jgi:hypothetical protein
MRYIDAPFRRERTECHYISINRDSGGVDDGYLVPNREQTMALADNFYREPGEIVVARMPLPALNLHGI